MDAIGNKTVAELAALTFTVSGTDADLPAQTLTYSASGLPAGATFDPATRQFNWTPAEDQGPGSYDVTFTVSDGSLSDAETITITVGEVNVAPDLAAIGNKTVKELTELTFTAAATDADLPANALTYSLVNAPAGATFDAATGVFTWTPSEGQGPADYTFTVRVTDNGSPALSDEEQITVTVTPSVWKYVDVAVSDSHTYGTVSGVFSATHQAGGGVQSVTEELYDKSRRTRLEHAWTFDVTGGDVGVSFHVLAGHNSTKEAFRFEYDAQDGLGWRALVTLTANAVTSYTVALPPSLSGQVLVRVVDTDRSRNEKVIDTVTIDQMYLESRRSTPLPPTIGIRASDSAAAETGPDAGEFLIELVDGRPQLSDLTVRYTISGTAGTGDYQETFSGSVVLPAGQLSVALPVTPVDDTLAEGRESLTITLVADPAYVLATPAATIDIADNDLFVAQAESHQYGTVSGSYLATQQADGQMQRLTEELYSGGKKSRLEHRWSFDLTGETSVEFQVTARHLTAGDPDNFQFQLSTNGGTAWTPLLTVTPTSPLVQAQTVTLPSAVGTVLVRVIDTDGSQDRARLPSTSTSCSSAAYWSAGRLPGWRSRGTRVRLSAARKGRPMRRTSAAPANTSATLSAAIPPQGQASAAEEDSLRTKFVSSRKQDSVSIGPRWSDTLLANDDDPLWP